MARALVPDPHPGLLMMLSYSAACNRNKDAILAILTSAFAAVEHVLEIGSGTGQHAVYFGQHLPHLVWQASDLPEYLAGIEERFAAEAPANVLPPVELDVRRQPWPVESVDAIFSANTLHIMSWTEIEALFAGLSDSLNCGGVLCIYGPFRYGGAYTSESNAAFDQQLLRRDPDSGIRDFEQVDQLAQAQQLELLQDFPMPANNQTVIWRRTAP